MNNEEMQQFQIDVNTILLDIFIETGNLVSFYPLNKKADPSLNVTEQIIIEIVNKLQKIAKLPVIQLSEKEIMLYVIDHQKEHRNYQNSFNHLLKVSANLIQECKKDDLYLYLGNIRGYLLECFKEISSIASILNIRSVRLF